VTKPDPLPASARANRPYGSGVRGIQLFLTSPLVALQKEFSSTFQTGKVSALGR